MPHNRRWDFYPPPIYDWDYIKEGKMFFESLEKEIKEKNKPKDEKKSWNSFFQHWLFLVLVSPLIGMTYAYLMVIMFKALADGIK